MSVSTPTDWRRRLLTHLIIAMSIAINRNATREVATRNDGGKGGSIQVVSHLSVYSIRSITYSPYKCDYLQSKTWATADLLKQLLRQVLFISYASCAVNVPSEFISQSFMTRSIPPNMSNAFHCHQGRCLMMALFNSLLVTRPSEFVSAMP